jgi:hypothetical protein
MKTILAILFVIVLALETESAREIMIQASLILAIMMSFIALNKREERIQRLKSDVFFPMEKQ